MDRGLGAHAMPGPSTSYESAQAPAGLNFLTKGVSACDVAAEVFRQQRKLAVQVTASAAGEVGCIQDGRGAVTRRAFSQSRQYLG